jgi:hypothetical protein
MLLIVKTQKQLINSQNTDNIKEQKMLLIVKTQKQLINSQNRYHNLLIVKTEKTMY